MDNNASVAKVFLHQKIGNFCYKYTLIACHKVTRYVVNCARKMANFILNISLLCFFLSFSFVCFASPSIYVNGLFKNQAVLTIDGKQRIVKVGKSSPEGVKLISTTTSYAVLEIDGERKQVDLSNRIGGGYSVAEKKRVQIQRQRHGGHFTAKGMINKLPVEFIIDTGASQVSFNAELARKLGIEYKDQPWGYISTANGKAKGYAVMLNSVSVLGLELKYVEAIVMEGGGLTEVLLGNSFLKRMDMKIQNNVMVLESVM